MSNFKNVLIGGLIFLLVVSFAIIYLEYPQTKPPTGLNAILNINPLEAKPLLKYLKSNEKVQFKILKDECFINNKAGLPPLSDSKYLIKASQNTIANCKEILKLSK